MEPRIILVKPAHLPILPSYNVLLRSTRGMTSFMLVYPLLLALLVIYLRLNAFVTVPTVVSPSSLP